MTRSLRLALVATVFVVAGAFVAPPPAEAAAGECEPGSAREGSACMDRIAPAGACAGAEDDGSSQGAAAGCEATENIAERFSPTDVAGGPQPPQSPPPFGPNDPRCAGGACQPGGGGPPGGGGTINPPPPPVVILPVEQPARPILPPGARP